MKDINPGFRFSFAYQSFDQAEDLFVKARVYDVTDGSPALAGSVVMTHAGQGLYSGTYLAVTQKIYLVIALVYTDNTYATVDTDKSPYCEGFRCIDAAADFPICYGAFDFNPDMPVAANIYDVSDGTPSLLEQLPLDYIFGGVYFALCTTGVIDGAYAVNTSVYDDDTYAVLDHDRPSGSDNLVVLQPGVVFEFNSATLTGQSTHGVLEALC